MTGAFRYSSFVPDELFILRKVHFKIHALYALKNFSLSMTHITNTNVKLDKRS